MKGIIVLCGLFVASFALSLTGLFTASFVSAVSPNDGDINVTSDYTVEANNYYSVNSEPIDVSNWIGNTDNPDWYYNQTTMNSILANYDAYRTSPNYSKVVSKSTTKLSDTSYITRIQLVYSPQPIKINLTGAGANAVTTTNQDNIFVLNIGFKGQTYANGSTDVVFTDGGRYYSYPVSTHSSRLNDNGETFKIIETSNVQVTYPEDYSGTTVPGVYLPPNDSNGAYSPDITYSYDDLDLDFYSDSSKNLANLDDYYIYWFISNSTTDGVQPSESYGMSGCTPPDETSELEVPIYGEYTLQAYYADTKCNILNKDNDGNILTESLYVFNIDGGSGSGSVGGSDNRDIEENKLVSAIRNINVDDHGLQTLILAPAQLFTQMATWSGSCSSITMPFLSDKTLKLECVRGGFSSNYPVIYGVIQVIIGGLIAYFVAVKTFAIVKQSNDPEDDKIEVNKL